MSAFTNTDICKGRKNMRKLKVILTALAKDESGQGATEYILLLVIVVGVAMLFRDQIGAAIKTKVTDLGNQITSFTGGQQ
jgi:Flp pilus assembly pilin Flp